MTKRRLTKLGLEIQVAALERGMKFHEVSKLLNMPSYTYLHKVMYGEIKHTKKYDSAIRQFLGERYPKDIA